jgi:mono/diheme cytochrome c family protein
MRTSEILSLAVCLGSLAAPGLAQSQPAPLGHQALLQRYCATCHSTQAKTADVVLQGLDPEDITHNAALLERVLRKIKTGQMPPAGMPRPDAAQRAAFTSWLEGALDAEAAAHPDPGRPAIHRLNRVEYSNAIRDVFDLDINAGALLPVDDTGYGFDNIGDVLSLSPTLLDRYLSLARRISRLAIGDLAIKPSEETFEPRRDTGGQRPIPARLEWVSDDLPFNSAGGLSIHYYFPLDAEYVLRANFGNGADKAIEVRLPIKAGMREVGVTFPRQSLLPEVLPTIGGRGGRGGVGGESAPIPVDLRLDGASLKRSTTPGALGQLPRLTNLTISGPYNPAGSGDTASRSKILICKPGSPAEEDGCAGRILAQLARHAYRRPVTDADTRPLLAFYRQARGKGTFEYGIQKAVEAVLISPDFLFRVESDAAGKPGGNHRVSGVEMASRLSFFLWSSVPDDELLGLAEKGKLADPQVLKQQVERMLDDPKSKALTSNFAGQWLFIRNVETVRPDPGIFPDFDESLRASMRQESELFFDSIVRENRSAMDLLTANYTFLNDRLAKHYGIPGIYGSQFRRVELQGEAHRGGLLGQASILTVTSPPNRTSVVQRGKWLLDNLLGAPPAPPPPVPALEATTKGHPNLSLRAALELHRSNPACAGCHKPMDPLGFALENYNGIGEWRTEDGGSEIDATGKLPDGTEFNGPAELSKMLTTARREEFATTVASKILTYALGRGLEYYDQPVVRSILRETSAGNYRLRDLISAVVMSTPFQMRRSPDR